MDKMTPQPIRQALILLSLVLSSLIPAAAQAASPTGGVSAVWSADQGNGTYKNPVLFADYSDPDVIRVGDTFYLVASSFNQIPGLPILTSKDLVNWHFAAHALPVQPPDELYSKPQHGKGVWAPAIRFHDGKFFIFYPDPDLGIYMTQAKSIQGPWSAPLLIKAAPGWIDPCPLWDDDGNAYLVNALAGSRGGIKNIVVLSRMAPDGTALLDSGSIIVDGHLHDQTLEGPKIYKRHGYYYISAPAGGVVPGYHVVLRSKDIYGPYERRVVLAQGKTSINGPHQGAWVDTPTGEDWFLHFRDQGPYGRVLYLEPMHWANDWPVIGQNISKEGTGEPVATFRKPNVPSQPIATLPDSDEFNEPHLGPQWQWEANPQSDFAFPSKSMGALRLINEPQSSPNLWNLPNLLLQKFPAPDFTVTTKLTFTSRFAGEETGLVVLGQSYAYIAVRNTGDHLEVRQVERQDAEHDGKQTESQAVPVTSTTLYLRARVERDADKPEATVSYSFSTDGSAFQSIGTPFHATPGRWVGARIGLFATSPATTGELGYADFDWFRFSR
ncbi:glycoside hydrolase family 43 protein [Granulicella tundricola]|uniref:Glycoside hydrolase family 43 n=1 Tax=Granulicella tundricola (strain ATCC BAA-1859 / DSM 23138 / MP5ACTX9) TaxID=1198114 RepID=E8X5Y9_GRATM|nr:glycoside hydrolase family 43 [Granulicella tundricola MP5ACTX9]